MKKQLFLFLQVAPKTARTILNTALSWVLPRLPIPQMRREGRLGDLQMSHRCHNTRTSPQVTHLPGHCVSTVSFTRPPSQTSVVVNAHSTWHYCTSFHPYTVYKQWASSFLTKLLHAAIYISSFSWKGRRWKGRTGRRFNRPHQAFLCCINSQDNGHEVCNSQQLMAHYSSSTWSFLIGPTGSILIRLAYEYCGGHSYSSSRYFLLASEGRISIVLPSAFELMLAMNSPWPKKCEAKWHKTPPPPHHFSSFSFIDFIV